MNKYKKYFTFIFWKLQIPFFIKNGRMLNIVETVSIEIDDDSDIAKLISGKVSTK